VETGLICIIPEWVRCSRVRAGLGLDHTSPLNTRSMAVDEQSAERVCGLIEEAVNTLTTTDKPAIETSLGREEASKLHATLAYCAVGLGMVALRIEGVDVKEHPLIQELEKIKKRFDNVEAVRASKETEANARINQAYAKRVVSHALASNHHRSKR